MTREETDAANLQLQRAYQLCFNSPSGQIVLLDLMRAAKFRTPASGDIDEGKRQLFLRIMNFVVLTSDQLTALYQGRINLQGASE